MRNLLNTTIIILTLLTSFSIQAAYVHDKGVKLTTERIINVDNKSKEELYNLTLDFFATTWVNSKKVIRLVDSTRGRIIAKGHFGYFGWSNNIAVKGTIQVDFKDGKVKIVLSNLENTAPNGVMYGSWSISSVEENNQPIIDSLFDSIELALSIDEKINEDW